MAFYTFHLARTISLIDSFIHILQGKPLGCHTITAGIVFALGPPYTWVCARFARKDPAFDFELVLIAFTHCLVYLYYSLLMSGTYIEVWKSWEYFPLTDKITFRILTDRSTKIHMVETALDNLASYPVLGRVGKKLFCNSMVLLLWFRVAADEDAINSFLFLFSHHVLEHVC